MSERTGIAWCDSTVNFWWGCQEVSPGCDHCYAKTLAKKLRGMEWGPGSERQWIKGGAALAERLNRKAAKEGRRWRVFTNSMSDFFDNAVPEAWRTEAWATISECTALDWLILTKRPQNIAAMLPQEWGEGWAHVWLGISAENQAEFERRWPHLIAIPAALRWVSAEPLLAKFSTKHYAVDWLVIGGESGINRRDCGVDALTDTMQLAGGKPVFMKQDSARLPDQQGRIPNLYFIREWPESPASRLFPDHSSFGTARSED
jgi:protein gp37